MKTEPPPVRPSADPAPRLERGGTAGTADTAIQPTVAPRMSELTAAASPMNEFRRRLDAAMAHCHSAVDVLAAVADLLRAHSALFVGRYRPAGSRIGEPQQLDGLTAPADGLDPQLQLKIAEICESARDNACLPAAGENGTSIHAVACRSDAGEVLVALSDGTTIDDAGFSLMLSLAAARISEKHLEDEIQNAERGSRHAAALVELISHLDQCRDIEDGAGRLSRELQRYLQADRVMVGFCEDDSVSCTLISDTGQETIHHGSEDTRLIQALMEESVGREAASLWPPEDSENRHALQAHAQLANRLKCRAIAACPLTTEKGRTIGAIAASYGLLSIEDEHLTGAADPGSPPIGNSDSYAIILARRTWTFLAAASTPLAGTLMLLDRSAPGLLSHLRRTCRQAFTTRRRATLGIIAAVVTAVLLLPLHYRISCDAELQPVWRRFVATPFDGTLQECLARPGEYVERGALLAVMDEREIQWELAGIQADMSRAQKERNTHLAEHNHGDAAIARHEIDRLRHRSDLLTFRSDNLELRSPIDGIVVSGDHKDEEGVPLKTGDTLFEIAPLDLMIVEIAVPEEDIRWVREGMPVTLQLNAMPAERVDAMVTRVYPRAELRDHDNVFIVEAEISNTGGLLRPGMRGSVQIISDRHTLGWNVFHKPAAWMVGWLGW